METSPFQTNFFVDNRRRLRELFQGTAPIVITAQGIMQRSGDTPFPFHQDSNFWYLTGIDEPDVVLVIDRDKEYLIIPSKSEALEHFDGAIVPEELSKRSGITDVLNEKDGWKRLTARLKRVKHVATIGAAPVYIEQLGMYTNPARRTLIQKLKEINGELELLDLREHLSHMRVLKQPMELEAIQKAIDITIDTITEVCAPRRLAKYTAEYEIEAEITKGFRYRGAEGHAFPPIVAAGKSATTIHNFQNNRLIETKDIIVLDIGAEVDHYSADITRTYSLNQKPSPRQRAVFQAVVDTQDYALSLIKPGMIIREYEKEVEQYMGEKLRELLLIQSIESSSVRKYFPHATSHFLGLDVHDIGDYSEPLKPGMVLTCEPGLYIPEEGIGVRIEDDILVTEKGSKSLSKRLPRHLVSTIIK